MVLDADSAYLALKARDVRFDGRFFVGVTSTGVYCRPVCRVRTPRRENCRFFDNRAQAEAAAFRPCMKCRPEIAPGFSHTDSSRVLADSAARFIEHAVHAGDTTSVPLLAARLGVTDRHLRRIFQRTHGVAPRDYIGTQRLLLAKQLLSGERANANKVVRESPDALAGIFQVNGEDETVAEAKAEETPAEVDEKLFEVNAEQDADASLEEAETTEAGRTPGDAPGESSAS